MTDAANNVAHAKLIAGLHLMPSDPAAATQVFKAVLSLDDKLTAAWMGLAVAATKAGEGTLALAAIEQAVALEPANVGAQCIRAEIALELLDLSRAVLAIEACIKADPQGTHPSGVRARALLFRVKDRL